MCKQKNLTIFKKFAQCNINVTNENSIRVNSVYRSFLSLNLQSSIVTFFIANLKKKKKKRNKKKKKKEENPKKIFLS